MQRVLVLCLLLIGLGGCSEDAVESASMPSATPRILPIEGRWIWVNGSQAMPSRDVGCAPGQAKLSISSRRIAVEGDGWTQPAFTIADWREEGGVLTLTLDDTSAEGRRRLQVDLAVSDAAFVRFLGSRAGASAQARRHEPSPSQLAGAFTLLRCADETFETASLLRAGTEPNRMQLRP